MQRENLKALKAFKCMLELSWHIMHLQGEMSCYYNLALTNFYLGRIEKSEYYVNRCMRGKAEAIFSVTRKIALAYAKRKYKGIISRPSKNDGYKKWWTGGEIL